VTTRVITIWGSHLGEVDRKENWREKRNEQLSTGTVLRLGLGKTEVSPKKFEGTEEGPDSISTIIGAGGNWVKPKKTIMAPGNFYLFRPGKEITWTEGENSLKKKQQKSSNEKENGQDINMLVVRDKRGKKK